MQTIKRTVRVTIEKEIEIELLPSLFGTMTEAEYLSEFCRGLWPVSSIDEVVKYAARTAALENQLDIAGSTHDGLGLMMPYKSNGMYKEEPDVTYCEVFSGCNAEVIPCKNT